MIEDNLRKGLITGIIGIIFVGLQPIIALLRPIEIDAYISGAMTCLVETLIFFPLVFIELKKNSSKNQIENRERDFKKKFHVFKGWKNNLPLLIFIGIIFSINQIFFFIGYDMARAIIGSLTQKTTVFFSIILGFLILKERITKLQIVFSFVLFFGLAVSITQFFTLIEINMTILMGVGILLLISFLWMLGHTFTKPIFSRKEATPIQMVFLRNSISAFILITTYFIFFSVDFTIFLIPINLLFFFVMGAVYGSGLVCWYKTLSYLDVSKASIIFAPTPIISAVFATLILGENFTIFHLIGTILVIISIIIIVNQKKE